MMVSEGGGARSVRRARDHRRAGSRSSVLHAASARASRSRGVERFARQYSRPIRRPRDVAQIWELQSGRYGARARSVRRSCQHLTDRRPTTSPLGRNRCLLCEVGRAMSPPCPRQAVDPARNPLAPCLLGLIAQGWRARRPRPRIDRRDFVRQACARHALRARPSGPAISSSGGRTLNLYSPLAGVLRLRSPYERRGGALRRIGVVAAMGVMRPGRCSRAPERRGAPACPARGGTPSAAKPALA